MAVNGLAEVLRNLNREIGNIQGNTRRGLSKAGLFIKGEAVERTPVEFGALRNSAFTQISPISNQTKPFVTVGFTAAYAAFVHEAPGTLSGQLRRSGNGVYWQSGENKFLEKAVKQNTSDILHIIRVEAGSDLQGNLAT